MELIANNDLTKVIMLIPLVGYIILFNDQFAEISSFRMIAGAESDASTPFFLTSLTKMKLVFIGSLLLMISNFIFRVFSPEILKLAKGDIEFSARVTERYSVHELSRMERDVLSDHWQPRLSLFWIVQGQTRAKKPLVSGYRPDVRSQMFSQRGDYISFLAREWWTGEMHTHRVARCVSLVTGSIGFFLLAMPTLDISQAVIANFLPSLW
ncbi:hypothetical protein [Roseibium sp. MMSF_3412]|uniref:hypothetical protein n=1 Tax=Roseibium sp. MMSF_3412 TaxID=3046712 RepID=UPI00273EEE3C|nr:hypothetical protein [Roseibium sp. MMSF_3412]